MPQEKIYKFLASSNTSSSDNSTPTKRIPLKRSRSSPENLYSQPDKKVNLLKKSDEMGTSNNDELLQAFGKMMDAKIAILPTRDDFNSFREEMRSLKIENESLKMEIKSLKENERQLIRRIDILENNARKNNLIIKGLSFTDQDNLFHLVNEFISNVMQIKDKLEIVEVRPLGNKSMKQRHVLVTFLRNHEKWAVLRQSFRLKGTVWRIVQDFPFMVRRRRHNLFRLRWEIRRLNSSVKCEVRSDKLILNGNVLSWDDSTGLIYKGDVGISKLKELVGHDLTGYIGGLLAEQPNSRSIVRASNPPVLPGRQQSASIINKA